MQLAIPTLETERLRLRPFGEADVTPFFDLSQDPEVVRYVGDRHVPTLQEAWRAVTGWLGHWALRGYGQWAIEERAGSQLIARAGIIYPADWPGPEVGYLLGRDWWGNGYATEAAQAATRLGETLRDEIELWGHRVRRYAIAREAWQTRVAG